MSQPRLVSVDLIRGLVLVLMVLGHVRILSIYTDYRPTDLEFSSNALFLTRWLTHIAAPVFLTLTGLGTALALQAGKPANKVAYFLLTRGLWLVALELTVIHFGWAFNFGGTFFLQIIWVHGCCMILLAFCLRVPKSVLSGIAIVVIMGHNLFDLFPEYGQSGEYWLYRIIRGGGAINTEHLNFYVEYPVLPWFSVMLIGFLAGYVYRLDKVKRVQTLAFAGGTMLLLFILLRWLNFYGDPDPWLSYPDAQTTFLSFVNVERYPPSLLFLLMTLGISSLLLAMFESIKINPDNPLNVLGRVPLFLYIVHLYLVHWLVVLTRTHFAEPLQFHPVSGFELGMVYILWLVVLILIYPLCKAYGALKQTRKYRILSYI